MPAFGQSCPACLSFPLRCGSRFGHTTICWTSCYFRLAKTRHLQVVRFCGPMPSDLSPITHLALVCRHFGSKVTGQPRDFGRPSTSIIVEDFISTTFG